MRSVRSEVSSDHHGNQLRFHRSFQECGGHYGRRTRHLWRDHGRVNSRGLFEGVLGFFIKPLRKFFPAVVTGTVVLSIGLSLISVGINSFGGGSGAKDFGSMENLLLAIFVLVVILSVKHWTNGIASNSAILIGIIAGYIAAFVMSLVLPTTGITADGAEYTKAWY